MDIVDFQRQSLLFLLVFAVSPCTYTPIALSTTVNNFKAIAILSQSLQHGYLVQWLFSAFNRILNMSALTTFVLYVNLYLKRHRLSLASFWPSTGKLCGSELQVGSDLAVELLLGRRF